MLISMLLAASIAQSPIVVAPLDPRAAFKGDGTIVEIDRACAGKYTADTVKDDPDCAGRFAKGDLGTLLAVAVSVKPTRPQAVAHSVATLERAIAESDSPAAHYFLGNLLARSDVGPRDYKRAAQHLNIAAERGNAPAADGLANLIVEGKGTARDMPRAISLYEKAAANGYPQAAFRLAGIYFAGRLVPKDEARGIAWLEAAEAAKAPNAAAMVAMARGMDKVANYQLIPSPDPAKVRAVKYGMFDNPEIPPNFGFDPEFQQVYRAPYDDEAVLARLERDHAALPTPYLFELARRLAVRDPKRSLVTFLLAQVRMGYDILRCVDPAAREAMNAWSKLIGPDIEFLAKGPKPPAALFEEVLAREASMPGDAQPWWVCRSGMTEMMKAMEGKTGPLQLKPESEWPALRVAAREALRILR